MLPKSRRISQAEAKELFTRGANFHSPNFMLKVLRGSGESRFAVSISKKVAASAVARNRIRRRVYSSVYRILPTARSGFRIGFSAKPGAKDLSFDDLYREIGLLLKKAGIGPVV